MIASGWPVSGSTRLTMAVYNVTLGVDCGHCHTLDDWKSAAKAPMKQTPAMMYAAWMRPGSRSEVRRSLTVSPS